jgi:RNA polymerase sigma-70 factor (ECF subfamily)
MGTDEPDPEVAALREAGADRERAFGELFDRHRRRLLKMVHLRMDARLRARVGASDVLQDAFVEASRRLPDYLDDPKMPFFLWLRFLTAQRLLMLHRRHLLTGKRDARRDAHGRAIPDATNDSLADQLEARGTTPTQGAARAEFRARILQTLDAVDPDDRRVLALRHFEELTNVEAARELGIEPAAASKRYVRALKRLKAALDAPGSDPAGES